MARKMVAMRLPEHTIDRLKFLARNSSQSNTVIEMVDERFGCPVCGNVAMDTLVWNEETDLVTCERCDHTYEPGAEA